MYAYGILINKKKRLFLLHLFCSSLVVMDYDEFSKDDFIGGTRVNLYELLIAQSSRLTLRRLLDDRKVRSTMQCLCDKESNLPGHFKAF